MSLGIPECSLLGAALDVCRSVNAGGKEPQTSLGSWRGLGVGVGVGVQVVLPETRMKQESSSILSSLPSNLGSHGKL